MIYKYMTWHLFCSRTQNLGTGIKVKILVQTVLLRATQNRRFFRRLQSSESTNKSIFLSGDFSKVCSRLTSRLFALEVLAFLEDQVVDVASLLHLGLFFNIFTSQEESSCDYIIPYCIYQRVNLGRVRQFIGEQLLLKSFFSIVDLWRATELTLPLLWEFNLRDSLMKKLAR
jgi:hypothetical protein